MIAYEGAVDRRNVALVAFLGTSSARSVCVRAGETVRGRRIGEQYATDNKTVCISE